MFCDCTAVMRWQATFGGDCGDHCATDGNRSANGLVFRSHRPGVYVDTEEGAESFNSYTRIGSRAAWSRATTEPHNTVLARQMNSQDFGQFGTQCRDVWMGRAGLGSWAAPNVHLLALFCGEVEEPLACHHLKPLCSTGVLVAMKERGHVDFAETHCPKTCGICSNATTSKTTTTTTSTTTSSSTSTSSSSADALYVCIKLSIQCAPPRPLHHWPSCVAPGVVCAVCLDFRHMQQWHYLSPSQSGNTRVRVHGDCRCLPC